MAHGNKHSSSDHIPELCFDDICVTLKARIWRYNIQSAEQAGKELVKEYKRVAIVEDFFDIIYGVHVEMDGRGGKHAGQKRTYRAIAETYSFLPREAVTRFLMACADCQKRMHIGSETTPVKHNNNNNEKTPTVPPRMNGPIHHQPHIIDFR
ncbi:hypothetical protein ACF0H5_004039 [Mactra antiquata]